MFIDGLYLIALLSTHCPEAIKEINDDYIVIDTSVCKDIMEELLDPFKKAMTMVSEIPPLLPTEDKAEGVVYPYVNLINQSVHIARAHIKQDFKSSMILTLITFIEWISIGGFSVGWTLLLYVFKTWMLYGRDYELG